ncbi:MAG: transcriptional regulator [Cyclobacteriaceae bacterium]|nr:transcriptional regulator [Cyclobacteriaceae bacterium]
MQTKTLLTQGSVLLRHFNDAGRPAFTLQEAAEVLKSSTREATKKLLSGMVKRGLLLRLKEGVYWIIPYDQDPNTYFPNTHLVVKYLAGNAGYYIGYYSALELHSLITQPSFRQQVVVNRQIKPSSVKIKGHKFQFIYHNPNHYFGATELWVDSFNKAACSDLEKTFIDCLYKPDYAGGISEIAKALYKSREKIDYQKLLNYCERFKAQSVIKRLGFLLELLKINNSISGKLHAMITPSYILLEPSYEKKGKMNGTWYVRQNMELSDIVSPIFS